MQTIHALSSLPLARTPSPWQHTAEAMNSLHMGLQGGGVKRRWLWWAQASQHGNDGSSKRPQLQLQQRPTSRLRRERWPPVCPSLCCTDGGPRRGRARRQVVPCAGAGARGGRIGAKTGAASRRCMQGEVGWAG